MRYWKPKPIPGKPIVSIAVASYQNGKYYRPYALSCLLASLQAQTFPDWRAVVVHDGPRDHSPWMVTDPRISYVDTPERVQQSGHPHRRKAVLDNCPEAEFCMFANDDGYYAPVWLEWAVSQAIKEGSDLVYCDFVRSHKFWTAHASRLKKGQIDIGSFIVRRSVLFKTEWSDFGFNGDGTLVEALVKNCRKTTSLPHLLYTHN